MSAPLDKGKPEFGTLREHYERAAKRGDRKARKKLRIPPYPDAVGHLVRWTYDLYGRDGAHMAGFNLLSNRELESFCHNRHIELDPLETEALFLLNAAFCNPDGDEDDEKDEVERRREVPLPVPQKGRVIVMADSTPAGSA